jgi:hypothetical protein
MTYPPGRDEYGVVVVQRGEWEIYRNGEPLPAPPATTAHGTVSNIGDVTSLDLHTTPSSIALLGLEVYASGGILGEKSMLIFLDDGANIVQVTYRFINEPRIRDGRRVDPVTCHFYNVS